MKMRETSREEYKEAPVNNKLFLNPERVSMPEQYWASDVDPITQGCVA